MKILSFYYCILMLVSINVGAQDIKGYYTRLDYDDGGFTGEYADIIIDLSNKGQFVFSREYSYLPYWKPNGGQRVLVKRLVPAIGDGPESRPDKNNISSNVAIVNRTDSTVTVHWRYAPDITKLSFVNFKRAYNQVNNPSTFYNEYVDEYFIVKTDGSVERIVKKGCYRLDEWNDPKNQFTQELKLTSKSIKELSLTKPELSGNYGTILKGSKINPIDLSGTILSFSFDEALSIGNGQVTDRIANAKYPINGVEDYWVNGVSGAALLFDSYSNSIIIPADKTTEIKGDFSISVWVAPMEYPFNKAAVIDHLNQESGYFLGMNRLGEMEFMIGDGSQLFDIRTNALPLHKWTYVVATYSKTEGLKLFLNGKLSSEKHIAKNLKNALDSDISIGMTRSFKQYPEGAERLVTKGFDSNMVFSGGIDEINIFNSELPSKKIKSLYFAQKPQTMKFGEPYVLPSMEDNNNFFGASYTNLKFHKTWDGLWRVGNFSDIIVKFKDKPWRFVFWRGTRYLPSLVTDYGRNGIWSSDQGPEVFKDRCFEHMSDMLCRYSNIRLISSSPARVVVHWRNASVDIGYQWPKLNDKGQGIFTDEYWTIYPDGTSVRHQLLHNPVKENIIEMNQNEILLHPGQRPEEAVLNDAVFLSNENGEIEIRSRLPKEPEKDILVLKNLLYTNLNSSTKQFQIGEIGTRIETNLNNDIWWNGWNHYPIQLIPSDGTEAKKYDRSASFCPSTFREVRRKMNEETIESMQIYGLTRLKPEELTPLNRSWNFAPKVLVKSGCQSLGYNKAEKAYYFKNGEESMKFQIQASSSSPLINPAFVLKNFDGNLNNVTLKINNKIIEHNKGIEIDVDGNAMLVLWVEYSSNTLTDFEIKKL